MINDRVHEWHEIIDPQSGKLYYFHSEKQMLTSTKPANCILYVER